MEREVSEGWALVALRLSEEDAAAGYLAARKALMTASVRVASVRRLVVEHPRRMDYRAALAGAVSVMQDAQQRTERALQRYHAAQHRLDAVWTATRGREVAA